MRQGRAVWSRSSRWSRSPIERRPPAGGFMIATEIDKWRLELPALLDDKRTPRMKRTPGNGRERIGYLTFDRGEAILLEMKFRDRSQETDRVGMLRERKEL